MNQDSEKQALETNLESTEKERQNKEEKNPLQEVEEDFTKDVLIF